MSRNKENVTLQTRLSSSEGLSSPAPTREASYVGFVKENRKGEIKVLLGWEPARYGLQAHWAFPGGGKSRRYDLKITPSFPPVRLSQREESAQETALREVRQETKVGIKSAKLGLALSIVNEHPMKKGEQQQTHLFATTDLRRRPRHTKEMKRFHWFTLSEALDAAAQGEIININVLIGIIAVIEWYAIHVADKKSNISEKISMANGSSDIVGGILEVLEERHRQTTTVSALPLEDSPHIG